MVGPCLLHRGAIEGRPRVAAHPNSLHHRHKGRLRRRSERCAGVKAITLQSDRGGAGRGSGFERAAEARLVSIALG